MFDINNCKGCYETRCLVFKVLFNTEIEIKAFNRKINKLLTDQEHFRYIYDLHAYNKRTLTQNQLNILQIALDEDIRIGKEIRGLKNKFYN